MTKKARNFKKGLRKANRLIHTQPFVEIYNQMFHDAVMYGYVDVAYHLEKLNKDEQYRN